MHRKTISIHPCLGILHGFCFVSLFSSQPYSGIVFFFFFRRANTYEIMDEIMDVRGPAAGNAMLRISFSIS